MRPETDTVKTISFLCYWAWSESPARHHPLSHAHNNKPILDTLYLNVTIAGMCVCVEARPSQQHHMLYYKNHLLAGGAGGGTVAKHHQAAQHRAHTLLHTGINKLYFPPATAAVTISDMTINLRLDLKLTNLWQTPCILSDIVCCLLYIDIYGKSLKDDNCKQCLVLRLRL